ncbi:hypothetical protein G9A89_016904 [Geosiphon pyriformis]|nr:hypothetical protein G9A89_016904 [Geosiphon pyriformis]
MLHPNTLQDAVTYVKDFKSAELETNHTQAVNLVMNGSSELDSKLKQFSDLINQKLEGYLADNRKQLLINILPATVTEDESLAVIFPFEIEKLTETPLFSRATLKEKPIMAMYTDAKIDVDQAASTRIITVDEATKTPIGEIDNLFIEINDITVLIKVLVMEATQYQALNTQKLQLSQNRQHTHVSAMCGHFKPITMPSAPLIEFEEEKEKPIWKAYQVSWADKNYNELPLILSWDNKEYFMATRFYCHLCVIEHFRQPKQQKKWDNQLCFTCRTILPDKRMWNDIPGHEGTYNETCQYTILINNWVSKGTPINNAWKQCYG